MKKTINVFFVTFLIFGFLTGTFSQEANEDVDAKAGNDTRVVGGLNAVLGQVPYQVSLRGPSLRHFCGGTIVDKNWVLTAAHCIDGIQVSYVVAGTIYLNSGGVRLDVVKTIKHPDYKKDGIVNDVGLVKTLQSFVYNNYVLPAILPRWNVGGDYPLRVSGWGLTSYPGTIPNTLQYLIVKTLANDKCAAILKPFVIYNTNICTLLATGKGICSGDSGGPLMQSNIIHGVVSFANLCANGVPDGYARVFTFMSWILSTKAFN